LPTGTWLWIKADYGDAYGEALVHTEAQSNVVRAKIRLVERPKDALLRLALTTDDGGPLGEIKAPLEQVRLGEPGSYRLDGATAERGLLYRTQSGVFRLRVEPAWQSAGMIRGCFAPFERIVDLRTGAETLVAENVRVGGRVRLRVHAPGLDKGAQMADFAVEADATAGQSRGWRNTFIRTRPDGWEGGPMYVGEPMLWGALLPPGRHVLSIRSRDFADLEIGVDVRRREVTDVDVWLQPR
jgi:hypothetical protein